MRLQGAGVWSANLRYGDAGLIAEAAAELEELGYSAIWIPDVGGDVLASIENLLQATARIAVATGILNVWMHEPAEVAQRRASWSDAWKRRFLLGLGVSHAPLIDMGNPGRYTKPYSKMVDYLDGLDAAEVPWPVADRVLAALRPRMLGLARDRAAGAHPYFVVPEHVAHAREILGPDALIGVELAVVRDPDPSTARATARRHTATYVNLPNYTNNLRDFGYEDGDFADGGSDRLVDAVVAWGDTDAIVRRVGLMRDAGADHVCIQVIRPDDDFPRADWRELAPALVEASERRA
ncbi:MAG: TIGR03620 family F420-dependent LLM class oxidoreductase [Actinomycetota bacterium]|nr:TIGR03620 family F420-dependent LLM class oxidoreductase [Actinomycetota bacterium]